MIFPEGVSVADSNQSDTLVFHVGVEMALDVHTDGGGAFIEDGIAWFVIDKSTHGHSLLLSTTQNIVPVIAVLPSSFSVNEVCKSDLLEDLEKHVIGGTVSSALLNSMWVDYLVTEISGRQVWSLWDVEDLIEGWLMENATGDWPELSHNSEEGTLTTSVWTSDEKVHTWLDLEVHLWDQNITVWRENWDIDEFEGIADNNFTLVAHVDKLKLL